MAPGRLASGVLTNNRRWGKMASKYRMQAMVPTFRHCPVISGAAIIGGGTAVPAPAIRRGVVGGPAVSARRRWLTGRAPARARPGLGQGITIRLEFSVRRRIWHDSWQPEA